MLPVTKIDDATVFAEIRSPCPCRGSKNVDGCYRMMEYDRKLMEVMGADFIVLQSQAEENTENCRVAITRESSMRKVLVPAHIRVQNKSEGIVVLKNSNPTVEGTRRDKAASRL